MCANYDLCESCIVTLEGEISRADLGVGIFHDASHVFYRVPSSSSAWGRSKFGFGSGNMSMPIACYPIIVNRSNARHVGVTCSICRKQDPEGYLYQCQPCTAAATAFGPNTDIDAFQFCEACEAKGCHAPDHPRVKIAVPKIRVKTPSAELAESRAEVSRLKAQLEEMELEKAKAKANEKMVLPTPTRDEIFAILTRENELRLAPETQKRFRAVSSKPDGWLKVMEELQCQVADEWNLSHDVAFRIMRGAETLPGIASSREDLERVRKISLYRKYNRCVDGMLRVGDMPPDATLVHSSTGKNVALHSIICGHESSSGSLLGGSNQKPSVLPLIIFAGSYT